MLTVCVNGARLPEEHPALPSDPAVLARDAAASITEGAAEVHLHPKDAEGRDSLAPADLERWLSAFRTRLPGVPIRITTGAWPGSVGERLASVSAWGALPDLASLNWHEDGAEELAARLLARGVGIEAGLWTVGAARTWAASPHAAACFRVLIEVPDVPESEVRSVAEEMLDVVQGTGLRIPVLLHGEERSTWPAAQLARELGLATRIGLEDTLTRPDGRPAASNAELVALCRVL